MTSRYDHQPSAQKGPRSFRRTPSPNNAGRPQPGPDNKSQWARNYEHYQKLAQSAGSDDAVARENYWQHAEHFYRLMNNPVT